MSQTLFVFKSHPCDFFFFFLIVLVLGKKKGCSIKYNVTSIPPFIEFFMKKVNIKIEMVNRFDRHHPQGVVKRIYGIYSIIGFLTVFIMFFKRRE